MRDVVCSDLRLDERVIDVDLHCFANLFFEHRVDKTLVGRFGVLEIEQHDLVIVEPAVCDENEVCS